jgi:hypothetical protein
MQFCSVLLDQERTTAGGWMANEVAGGGYGYEKDVIGVVGFDTTANGNQEEEGECAGMTTDRRRASTWSCGT